MYDRFAKWLDSVLVGGLPDEAAAVNFNIYEDSGKHWSIQLIASSYFDKDDEDWAGDEVFTTGEDLFTWQQDVKWDDALKTAKQLIEQYLENGQHADALTKYEAVACGFVDGDINIIYQKQ